MVSFKSLYFRFCTYLGSMPINSMKSQCLVYSLSIVCVFTLLGCNRTILSKKAQPTNVAATITPIPSISPPVQNPPAELPISSYSSDELTFLPVSVIPSIVTPEEIVMREEQVKIVQEYKRLAENRVQAGVGTQISKLGADYFTLSNQIQLLQAKQLLQLKQQQEKK
ncbi:hypothetical protein PQG02_00555 (plasmid) [Nostoc sp. UHCC 0926]|uniref:hypothetical protein n=1 Tax=Nostoc sp. UHCC 0926 TaxID=3025190 RepID=UPI002362A49B|nr:hypothetical protein [Nostoc sp. UHCC 0926]WDD30193.1 hypothetical protein PQG02_00555 [Nostoc sp. UHCC 0926]